MERPDVEVYVKIGDVLVWLGMANLNDVYGIVPIPTKEAEYLFSNEVNPEELIERAREKIHATD